MIRFVGEDTLTRSGHPTDVTVEVAQTGHLVDVRLARWNSGASPPKFEPFGGRLDDEFITSTAHAPEHSNHHDQQRQLDDRPDHHGQPDQRTGEGRDRDRQ